MTGSDRFSFRSREAFKRATEIVERYGHNRIDTEHLLLVLIEQSGSPVAKLLDTLGLENNVLIDRVVLSMKASPRTGISGGMRDNLNLTERTRCIIEQAGFEADLLDDNHIAPEHLFLAVFNEQGTPAVQILAESGLNRKCVLEALKQYRTQDTLAWDE
jgi:ATP-dependent Clp protease ATP-binding subunit ClpC